MPSAQLPDGLVVASNRGPVSFRLGADGELAARRGAGGLVSTLGPALAGSGATWVAAAMGDGDRRVAAEGPRDAEGFRLALLALDPDDAQASYDVICNQTLWFAHHALADLPTRPSLDAAWHRAWASFERVNEAFADAIASAAPEGGTVLVQDLHLSLVGGLLRERRPDLRTSHFAHTPFCWPDQLAVLPRAARRRLLEGLAGHGACGFHTGRWERAFLACCAEEGVSPPPTYVAPAAADPADVLATAGSTACSRRAAELALAVGDRKVIARVDRMELSKNVVRGFEAYELLLATRPQWRGQVVFAACCYPSREGLPEYAAYRDRVLAVVRAVNERWGTEDWKPVHLVTEDDFPRSVATLARADVALVNPVRDGLNIVAKELAIVNERGAVLCLSPQAGVWDELGAAGAVESPPFDLVATADALHLALSMPAEERAERARTLRAAATAVTPEAWIQAQIAAAR